MKFLKWVLVLAGLAALVAGGVMLGSVWVDMGKLMATVRSYNDVQDPTRKIMITSAVLVGGGLLLGWGVGLPSRTARGIRKAYDRDLETRGIDVNMDGKTLARQAEPAKDADRF